MERREKILMTVALLAAVAESPNGAPEGPLYMGFMHHRPDMTALEFDELVQALLAIDVVKRSAHVLYCTEKGLELAKAIPGAPKS
jgi:hypothetical protein